MKETGAGSGRLLGLPSCLGPLRMEGLILYLQGRHGGAGLCCVTPCVFGVFWGVVCGQLRACKRSRVAPCEFGTLHEWFRAFAGRGFADVLLFVAHAMVCTETWTSLKGN